MNKINYQLVSDELIKKITEEKKKTGYIPSLLLHSCCAPCSSYTLEYLSDYFNITLYYYNPNISPEKEFLFRVSELERFTEEFDFKNKVSLVVPEYRPEEFIKISRGLENLPEGGERCYKCYELRLEKTAQYAKENNFDYFTTTLSISPYKNSAWLNEIGGRLAEKYKLNYFFSDFKKRGGYKRSIELSNEYSLYRQNYCGCVYSYAQMMKKNEEKLHSDEI